MKKRASVVCEKLNKMQNVTCNEVEGAMYAFPKIVFSNKVYIFLLSNYNLRY
jgi:aspartate/methionine/tyrosine aminotransferase